MRLKRFGLMSVLALGLMAGASGMARGAEGVTTMPSGVMAGAEEKPADPVSSELDSGTLIVTIIIFVCLFVVLSQTAWKPIMAGLKGREAAIRDSIEAAARAKADAERTTKELEAKMAEAQRQGAAQLQQAKSDALKIAEAIRVQAEAEATALKERTLREIESAKQQALTDINNHAAELGTAVARKILQRNVTVDDQQRLVEGALAEMGKRN